MDIFRTKLPPLQSDLGISHQHRVLCIGSCFAEHIGGRLAALKFPVLLNPFGIVYNPVSVVQVLEKLLSGKYFQEADLFENLGLWHSFDHHGRFSHPDKATALRHVNQSLDGAKQFLAKTERLVLTLGTAHVFVYKKTNAVVANCHKMPGQAFDRRRLTVEETVQPLMAILQRLKEKLPRLEVITTVSPVRHLRDGLLENQRSKATLLLGLEAVCDALPFVHYFPSYELLLDDLRDYRFYEKDLAHPNGLAVDYIWQYFENAFFSETTKSLCQRISAITTAANHRPVHQGSAAHQQFLKKQLVMVEAVENRYPFLDFGEEKKTFRNGQKISSRF